MGVKIMDKPTTFPQTKINIISLLGNNNHFPENIFSSIMNQIPQGDMEFNAYVGTRALSSYMNLLISQFGIFENDEYQGLNTEGQLYLLNTISNRFKDKWNKLDELWNTNYDPLSPFDITLNEQYTDTLNVTEDTSQSNSSQDVYGFNSVEPVPNTQNESSSSNKYTRENPHTRDYTRKGNIGNTSRQELVEQQREVLKYQIIDTIYKDIASVVVRGKYL